MTNPTQVSFFDVEGIPVTIGQYPGATVYCTAWDNREPRPFPPDSARRNGAPISEEKFKTLVILMGLT